MTNRIIIATLRLIRVGHIDPGNIELVTASGVLELQFLSDKELRVLRDALNTHLRTLPKKVGGIG